MNNQHLFRNSFLFFFLFILSSATYSQIEDFSLLSKKGKVFPLNGEEVKFKSFEEKENTFIFTTSNKAKVEIPKSNIVKIHVPNKGFAYSSTGAKVRFKSIYQKDDSFIFTTTNKTILEIKKSKIAKIDLQKGSYAKKVALSSAAITALTISTLLLHHELTTEQIPLSDSPLLIVIIVGTPTLTVGIIGGLIGHCAKKYKTIYKTSSIGYSEPKLNLKTTSPNAIPSLTLSYTL